MRSKNTLLKSGLVITGQLNWDKDCEYRSISYGSGTLIYKWKNAAGQLVGSSSELLNVPAGSYTLEVKDGSAWPALVSAPIMVPEINGVTVNTTNKVIGKASCNTSNGSITGIIVAGATSYQWIDAGNTPVANTLNLTVMPAGKYRLVASNATCSKISEELTIELAQTIKDYATTKVSTSATCALNKKIEAIFTKDQPAACFWKNNAGVVVGHSRTGEPGTGHLRPLCDRRFGLRISIAAIQHWKYFGGPWINWRATLLFLPVEG